MTRTLQFRAGPGALIILAHLVFFALLIRYAGTPSTRGEEGPADYITFALVPATPAAKPQEALSKAPLPAPRKRRAELAQAVPLPPAPVAVPSMPAAEDPALQSSAPEQAAPQGKRLDMTALRTDARRIASEHVPEPFEQVRDAERRMQAQEKDLGRAISNAKRPPCTKKYSGGTSLNVFALIPLAIDTITDTGCKW